MNISDRVVGHGLWKVEKYKLNHGETDIEIERRISAGAKPYEVLVSENVWLTTGWNELLKLITGQSAYYFDSTHFQIVAGNDATAAAEGQTGLLGTTATGTRVAGYPDTPTGGALDFKAKFSTSVGNMTWAELGLKQSTSGIYWNRNATGWGTKDSTEVWYVTVTLGKA